MVGVAFVIIGAIVGCGTGNATTSVSNGTNVASSNAATNAASTVTPASTSSPTSNPIGDRVMIQGTVQRLNSQGTNTIATIHVAKMEHTGTISSTFLTEFSKNQTVTMTFSGSPSTYGLDVHSGQKMMMALTPADLKTKAVHWDGYEYYQNGKYVNWKGQTTTFP